MPPPKTQSRRGDSAPVGSIPIPKSGVRTYLNHHRVRRSKAGNCWQPTLVGDKRDWCGGPESNRHGPCGPRDFKSLASTSSATPALSERYNEPAGNSTAEKSHRTSGDSAGLAAICLSVAVALPPEDNARPGERRRGCVGRTPSFRLPELDYNVSRGFRAASADAIG